MNKILQKFESLKDKKYKDYQKRHLPNIDENKILGVKIIEIRKIAKLLIKNSEYNNFIKNLPHQYLEEYLLHCMIISELKNYEYAIEKLEILLPFLDNWEVCDSIRPKSFKNKQKELFKKILKWIKSDHEYTVRVGIGMLMIFFLGEHFDINHLDIISNIKNKGYYVKMAIAWYVQNALTKHYHEVYNFLKEKKLDSWIQNKAIQKSKESFRITDKQKKDLEKLKIK